MDINFANVHFANCVNTCEQFAPGISENLHKCGGVLDKPTKYSKLCVAWHDLHSHLNLNAAFQIVPSSLSV